MKEQYIPSPIDTSEVIVPQELESLKESLAKNTHETWAAARTRDGWTYGLSRDDKLKTHPDLVPYEDLADEEKEYDRATAMETIKFILKQGYRILTPEQQYFPYQYGSL